MRRKLGVICMCLGATLLLGAALLFLLNYYEAEKAVSSSKSAVSKLEAYIAESSDDKTDTRDPYDDTMRKVEVDGYSYIGYISIPSLDLKLPVMSDWDYNKMTISPCRYSGSVKSGDMVIAGHNYTGHFGSLYKMKIGDEAFFTDMDGVVTAYKAYEIETLSPENVEEMINGDFDLTLFTCTYSGQSRITVRFELLEKQ